MQLSSCHRFDSLVAEVKSSWQDTDSLLRTRLNSSTTKHIAPHASKAVDPQQVGRGHRMLADVEVAGVGRMVADAPTDTDVRVMRSARRVQLDLKELAGQHRRNSYRPQLQRLWPHVPPSSAQAPAGLRPVVLTGCAALRVSWCPTSFRKPNSISTFHESESATLTVGGVRRLPP